MSDEMKTCPACDNPYGYYVSDEQYACPECGNEWNPTEAKEEEKGGSLVVKDSNGNLLQDGDSVVVIKNLPVKGMPQPIKSGTKVKKIRLREGDHNISCRIDGFGSMEIKSEFVKKA